MLACELCLEVQINACVDKIELFFLFESEYDYIARFTDKFDTQYDVPIHKEPSEPYTILVSDLPKGFFNPYQGTIYMSVYRTDVDCSNYDLKYGGQEWQCVAISSFNRKCVDCDEIIEQIPCVDIIE